ncbi:IS21-like element helper ATPase IstB [Aneurinibacillus sp. REN35]|uniref:IS21-like element helper ATPase IstB n=1 Tax=Aneurinibacillus sp. REN35 TaxID=3237286 RepID=UPI0035295A7D
MSEKLRELCKSLRLAYVAEVYGEAPFEHPELFLQYILERELELREKAKSERLIKKAKFGERKTLEGYQWHENIHLPASTNREALRSLRFIDEKENVVLIGSPGTGKTHLATALGIAGCQKGKEVRFFRAVTLIEKLELALAQKSLASFRKSIETCDLLIIDELGYLPFSKEAAELLFHIIAECYERKSIIVTSNLEFSQWNRIFYDARLTAALVDRLVHHAHVLSFTGESYRLKNALSKTSL